MRKINFIFDVFTLKRIKILKFRKQKLEAGAAPKYDRSCNTDSVMASFCFYCEPQIKISKCFGVIKYKQLRTVVVACSWPPRPISSILSCQTARVSL